LNFLMDISERKRAEETILRANKKLNLLNSITRHDALNQVTVISGYAALLEEVVRDPEQAEYVRKMRRSALSIQRQMEFTKIYQEIGAHAPTWQSLQESVHKAMGSLNLGDLVIRAQDLDYLIRADPMFEKVVYNLIENCLRHSGGARSMDISTTVEEGVLKLVFQDDGLGTSVEDKARLFERGYGKNTGFGLFLAKEVLGMTGIEIVENGEPGKGARFEITIPKEDWRAA
jgi:signal transduction histidine kinase